MWYMLKVEKSENTKSKCPWNPHPELVMINILVNFSEYNASLFLLGTNTTIYVSIIFKNWEHITYSILKHQQTYNYSITFSNGILFHYNYSYDLFF